MQSLRLFPPNSLLPIPPTLVLSHPFHFHNNNKQHQPPCHFSQSLPNLRLQTHARALADDEGPIELSPDTPSIFSANDDATPLQLSATILLTGAITVLLFRSIQRRARRAKEMKMRSTGATKAGVKDEALERLKEIRAMTVESKAPPSAVQALLGSIAAGAIAFILYKFTTNIEAGLNRQSLSDNFSVRQITITIRTIINGLCYLATFVFGMNSFGLFLYSGQLALNSFSEDPTESDTISKGENNASPATSSSEFPSDRESNDSDQTT